MTDDKLYTSLSANTIMVKLTNHVQRTRVKTSSTDKTVHLALKVTSAQVVETSVTNNSSFENYPHLDDHIICTKYKCNSVTAVSQKHENNILKNK